jgi:hypothetical protein
MLQGEDATFSPNAGFFIHSTFLSISLTVMDGYQDYCAGSQFTFSKTFDNDMDLDISRAPYPYRQQLRNQQHLLAGYGQSPISRLLLSSARAHMSPN